MIRGIPWVLAALLCPSVIRAQESSSFESLIAKLKSSRIRERTRAVERIAQLGQEALPGIERELEKATGQTKAYLRLASDEIRSSAALGTAYRAPSLLSLPSDPATFQEHLKILKEKSGVQVTVDRFLRPKGAPFAVAAREVSPLEALHLISKGTGAQIYPKQGKLHCTRRTGAEWLNFFYNHTWFQLRSISRTRTLTFRKPPVDRLSLSMWLIWDPHVTAVRPEDRVTITEAVDDRGKSLLVPPGENLPQAEAGSPEEDPVAGFKSRRMYGSVFEPTLLLPPSRGATRITRLKGYAPFTLLKTRTLIDLEGGQPGTEGEAQGLKAVVTSLNASGSYYLEAEVRIEGRPEIIRELMSKPAHLEIFSKVGKKKFAVAHFQSLAPPFRLRTRFGLGRPYNLRKDNVKTMKEDVGKIRIVVTDQAIERRMPFEFEDVRIP